MIIIYIYMWEEIMFGNKRNHTHDNISQTEIIENVSINMLLRLNWNSNQFSHFGILVT